MGVAKTKETIVRNNGLFNKEQAIDFIKQRYSPKWPVAGEILKSGMELPEGWKWETVEGVVIARQYDKVRVESIYDERDCRKPEVRVVDRRTTITITQSEVPAWRPQLQIAG